METENKVEMWRAVKWTLILCVTLVAAFCLFKVWRMATAPARAVETASETVKSGANAVFNRLDIPILKQRSFDRAANTAFSFLNEMAEIEPDGVKARGFRMANLRGSQNRVCEMTYDFGSGDVPIFVAADNAAHETAKAVASKADRLIRIVVVSPKETLGLNAEFDEEAKHWTLQWRPSSIHKAHPDDWAETPMTDILKRVPKNCGQAF